MRALAELGATSANKGLEALVHRPNMLVTSKLGSKCSTASSPRTWVRSYLEVNILNVLCQMSLEGERRFTPVAYPRSSRVGASTSTSISTSVDVGGGDGASTTRGIATTNVSVAACILFYRGMLALGSTRTYRFIGVEDDVPKITFRRSTQDGLWHR